MTDRKKLRLLRRIIEYFLVHGIVLSPVIREGFSSCYYFPKIVTMSSISDWRRDGVYSGYHWSMREHKGLRFPKNYNDDFSKSEEKIYYLTLKNKKKRIARNFFLKFHRDLIKMKSATMQSGKCGICGYKLQEQ